MTSLANSPRFRRLATRLVLALLVITLSFAWLPQPVAAQSVPAPTGATFAAIIIDDVLWIVGTGFTPRQKYQVRIRIADTDPLVKIGKVKANKAGKINDFLMLPQALAPVSSLQVCLKDTNTGKMKCSIARR